MTSRVVSTAVRPTALREAIHACRKGGSLFALGVFGGLVEKFPFGAIMNKGMTVRGAQQHGHRYIPMILERIAAGEISTEHLATHVLPLDQGPRATRCSRTSRRAAYARSSGRPGQPAPRHE